MTTSGTIIIGGGISGLVAANRLNKSGVPFLLIDNRDSLGGVLQTHCQSGYQFEGGPNTLKIDDPVWQRRLLDWGLGKVIQCANPLAKKRFILKRGQPEPLPQSFAKALGTTVFSFPAKIRLLADLFLPRGKDSTESVADFVRRRFGKEFLDYAINPMVAGIYAGDPEELSLKYSFPKLYALEKNHRSLLIGGIATIRKKSKNHKLLKSSLLSFKGGLATLPKTLSNQIHLDSKMNGSVLSVAFESGQWQVMTKKQTYTSSSLILAVPGNQWKGIKFPKDWQETVDWVSTRPYPPLSMWAMGFDRSKVTHPLDGFGMLIPEAEGFSILGVLFSSTLFPNRAPEGKVLLTIFMGGSRNSEIKEMSSQQRQDIVVKDLQETLRISGSPEFTKEIYWSQSIPQYTKDHAMTIAKLNKLEEKYSNLFFAGNIRDGVSVPNCMESGWDVAEKIISLKAKHQ